MTQGIDVVGLYVRDQDEALAFYVDKLGCAIVEDAVVEGGAAAYYSQGAATSMRLVLLKIGAQGPMVELMELRPRPPASARTAPAFSFTLHVDHLEAALARLGALGITPATAPIELALPRMGRCRIAFVHDPDGHSVELVELVGPSAAP